jgi:putative oxidoreductase
LLKQILFGGESGLSPLANAGLALLRIFTGVALALGHGAGKIPPSDKFIESTANMGFPMASLFAWSAGLSEFLGGIFLAVGLFTRISSFFVACTMLTALLGVHLRDPFATQEKAFLYLFIAVAFMLKGASDWSIDGFLRKR